MLIASLLLATAIHCGTERWDIKTGTDAAAKTIDLTQAQTATIPAMRVLRPPADIHHFQGRAKFVETTVFEIDATLVLFKSESDKDYHLVLEDDSGETMIAEIPSPRCVAKSSPFYAGVNSTRAAFEKWSGGKKSSKGLKVHVRVKGPGLFDFIHGQSGVAPNGIEIHPILSIEFPESKGK